MTPIEWLALNTPWVGVVLPALCIGVLCVWLWRETR